MPNYHLYPVTVEVAEYFHDVQCVVEATAYERQALNELHSNFMGRSWVEASFGYYPAVGTFGGEQITICVSKAKVNDRMILFYYASSPVVNHDLIDVWLLANLPDAVKKNGGTGIIRTDAANFDNIFEEEMTQ